MNFHFHISPCIKCSAIVTLHSRYLLCAFVVAHTFLYRLHSSRCGHVMYARSQQTKNGTGKECKKGKKYMIRCSSASFTECNKLYHFGARQPYAWMCWRKGNVLFLLWVYLMALAPFVVVIFPFSRWFLFLSRRREMLFIRSMVYSFVFISRLHFSIFVSRIIAPARRIRRNPICIRACGGLCFGAGAFMSVAIWMEKPYKFTAMIVPSRFGYLLDFISSLSGTWILCAKTVICKCWIVHSHSPFIQISTSLRPGQKMQLWIVMIVYVGRHGYATAPNRTESYSVTF